MYPHNAHLDRAVPPPHMKEQVVAGHHAAGVPMPSCRRRLSTATPSSPGIICPPIQERRAKKRRRFVSVGAALAILLCLGAWGAASLASGEDSQEEVSSSSALSTSAEETASEEPASESAVE